MVPVLSEQITVVEPNVSTDESCFTIEFFCARRFTPRARAIVIVAGNPSGTAATATEVANRSVCMKLSPCMKYPTKKSKTEIASVIFPTKTPIFRSSF